MQEFLNKILKAKTENEKATAVQNFLMFKYRDKFPNLSTNDNFIFPSQLSCEQSTSEPVAEIKAKQFKGDSFIDLTGGMGIDTLYFSRNFKQCIYIEKDEDLCSIFENNVQSLGIKNIQIINTDSIVYLKNTELSFDFIYIDPHRRKTGRKSISLADHEPNILENISLFENKSENILIKTSPLADFDYLKNELKVPFSTYVIEYKSNVREILLYVSKGNKDEKMFSLNIDTDTLLEINESNDTNYSFPKNYLLEPSPSIMKLQPWSYLCNEYSINKIAKSTHYFTSDKLVKSFPGNQYQIIEELKLDRKLIKKKGIEKANIKSRNYPLDSSQIKKKLNLKDGGNIFIFAFRDFDNNKRIFRCENIKT